LATLWNDAGGSRFAALDQITRDNVHQLKEVWRFRTGDMTTGTGNGAEDQMTPLQVGNKVFYVHRITTFLL
jgi:quinate dehydrogenase (quinone)